MKMNRARTWAIEVDSLPAGAADWPARVSVPLPRGEGNPCEYAVRGPDGRAAPAQARTLVHWPDGSPRWIQLEFQARTAGAVIRSDISGVADHLWRIKHAKKLRF